MTTDKPFYRIIECRRPFDRAARAVIINHATLRRIKHWKTSLIKRDGGRRRPRGIPTQITYPLERRKISAQKHILMDLKPRILHVIY